jgi:hypothetical protein
MEERVIEFLVIEKTAGGKWRGHGRRQFQAPPHIGDNITEDDDQGIGQAYEVVAVIHPMVATDMAGDLIIVHVGTDADFREAL